ncbi:hypothetical protein QP866_01810 [Corynebacterium imitans]|uniref:hypothetical protein n=1 Tax=Corynebacterium imitans TaxID=156978 RepID=UPI00254CFAB2|nr:hypothetical protein [Corynebacterium imitans]MDK8305568.1 hypothetical protein [Corynebacterium imitans]MDK8636566.1 hypothetical protein [Corynebacterium imitans]MDK8771760.1 hypothetical protein [Corynebacterium imitans]
MNYLRSEWIRSHGSTLWWLAGMGLLLGCVFAAFSLAGQVETAHDLMNWQGLLVTALAAPVAALFAGVVEARERKARSGGTDWRPVDPRRVRAARLVLVWTGLGAFCFADFGANWLVASVFGLDGVGAVFAVGAAVWVGMCGVAGVAAALVRRIGMLPTLLVALLYQVELGYFCDREWWWANPAAWPLRLELPLMGLQFNLLPLEPGSALDEQSPWAPFALCLLFAAFGAACAVWTPPRRQRRSRKTTHAVAAPQAAQPAVTRPPHVGFVAALRGVHRAGSVASLSVLLLLTALVMLVATRYPADVRRALDIYLILPVGAGLLPTLVWPRLAPAWQLMRIEHSRVVTALLAWVCTVVTLVVAFGALTGGFRLVGTVIALLTTSALALLALAITARFGVAWTLAAALAWTVLSVTIAGDVLADSWLWVLAVPAWAETATSPLRVGVALVGGVVLVTGAWVSARRVLVGQGAGRS